MHSNATGLRGATVCVMANFLCKQSYFVRALPWLKKSRTKWPANDSVWHSLRDAQTELPEIRKALEHAPVAYVRYMDDWCILAKTK
jgi:hypothetical protein